GYEMAVEGDVTQIQQQIQQIPGIRSIEVFDHADGGPYPCLRILTEPEVTVTGAQLATAIVQNGWGLHELRRTQANLEDVFLRLTTEEALTEEKLEPGETETEAGEAA
ncbi:MAG TPA: ABC transporter ATP-binding protein, partial [Coleofasciculaceae cyanobacterium]